MSKIRLGIFFGGRSTEHEVSILSTESVVKNLDAAKYEILPIAVTKQGEVVVGEDNISRVMPEASDKIRAARFHVDGELELLQDDYSCLDCHLKDHIDVAFPMIHGYLGEDGAIQGMLKMFDVPFVGPDVLGSAVCMDKIMTRRILRDASIPVVRDKILYSRDVTYKECADELGEILFVKTSDAGSSVGVYKVRNEAEFNEAVKNAFEYGNSVVVEEFFKGHEVECAVLGNRENVRVSCCGEIVVHSDFYSYEAKYVDPDAAEVIVPTWLPSFITDKVRETAAAAFKVLGCEGMTRADFLVKDSGEFIVNEFNTVPGFTSISMYPKAWEASGLKYSELLDTVIKLGLDRYNRDSKIERSYTGK